MKTSDFITAKTATEMTSGINRPVKFDNQVQSREAYFQNWSKYAKANITVAACSGCTGTSIALPFCSEAEEAWYKKQVTNLLKEAGFQFWFGDGGMFPDGHVFLVWESVSKDLSLQP